MHLLAHVTEYEGLMLAATFIMGAVTGGAVTWFAAMQWVRRGR